MRAVSRDWGSEGARGRSAHGSPGRPCGSTPARAPDAPRPGRADVLRPAGRERTEKGRKGLACWPHLSLSSRLRRGDARSD